MIRSDAETEFHVAVGTGDTGIVTFTEDNGNGRRRATREKAGV